AVSSRKKPICVNRQKQRRASDADSSQSRATSWWTWLLWVSATQTFTSGKRNEVVEPVIVDSDRAGPFAADDGQTHARGRRPDVVREDAIDALEDQCLGRPAFAGRAGLQPPVELVGDVDRGAHVSNYHIY